MAFTTPTVTPSAGALLDTGGTFTVSATLTGDGNTNYLYVRAYEGHTAVERAGALTFVSANYGAIPGAEITETDDLAANGEWSVNLSAAVVGTHTVQLTFTYNKALYYETQVKDFYSYDVFTPFWFSSDTQPAVVSFADVDLTVTGAAIQTYNYHCSPCQSCV